VPETTAGTLVLLTLNFLFFWKESRKRIWDLNRRISNKEVRTAEVSADLYDSVEVCVVLNRVLAVVEERDLLIR